MSFNSKAFLADRERLLEPDQQLQGNYRRHKELRSPVIVFPPQLQPISEYEHNRRQDEYLKSKGII